MRLKNFTYLAVLLAFLLSMPLYSGCAQVASYLLYQWIDDQFNNNGGDSEDPLITKVTADKDTIHAGDSVVLEVKAEDKQDSTGELKYFWVASTGTLISPTSRITVWLVPDKAGTATITIMVKDTDNNQDSASIVVDILE